jgi:hypothetical protein
MHNIAVGMVPESTAPVVPQHQDIGVREQGSVVEIRRSNNARESLSENFNNELEAWARHSLARNGFGDY